MVRTAGTNADTLNGFALAAEMREWRRRNGDSLVTEVSRELGLPRRLIDGLELGDYDAVSSRKHLTKWSRSQFLRLLVHYNVPPGLCSAYMQLALAARAFREDDSDDPVDPVEWHEAGGAPRPNGIDMSRVRAEKRLASFLERHDLAWQRLQSRRPKLSEVAKSARKMHREPGTLSPAAIDVLDFLAHASVGIVPTRLLERAGVAGGEASSAIEELQSRQLVSTAYKRGAQLVGLTEGANLSEIATDKWRWQGESWAWRAGLRYMYISIKDDARYTNVLPLGDKRNYVRWLGAAIEAEETYDALLAWTKLSRYFWETGRRELFDEVEPLGARVLEQLNRSAPHGKLLIQGIHAAERSYLYLELKELAEATAMADRALASFESLKDPASRALGIRCRALVLHWQVPRRRAEAEVLFREASELIANQKGPSRVVTAAIDELKELRLFERLVLGYPVFDELVANWTLGGTTNLMKEPQPEHRFVAGAEGLR